MPTDAAALVCKNQDCHLGEDGKCVEGLSIDQCPHVVRSDAAATLVRATESLIPQAESEAIAIPSGERLGIDDVGAVLRIMPSRVLPLIAPSDAGKTSLIAAVFDLLQRGPLSGLYFGRSRTIAAFEEACHHARAASRRAVPHTERTPLSSGVGFYHLELFDVSEQSRFNIVLADRAGEDYRSAGDDPSIVASFPEVRGANCITVLVDGDRLRGLGTRHNVRSEVEIMLQGLIDGEGIQPGQRLAVVLTKLDILQDSDEAVRTRAVRDFEALVDKIRTMFSRYFADITGLCVAASPATEVLPHGYGLADLLNFWGAASTPSKLPLVPVSARPRREIARLAVAE